ncbi:MAG: TRAP transporter small permease [Thermotogaceae bacterium]|nr:TRAP transporter small permease [Thermotogaceae bacterium]
MKKFYKAIVYAIDLVEIHINAIIFITLFLSMLIQIFMRYVLNKPSPLLHEITMYTFVWTVYLSAALAHRYNSHIRFNILYDKFPRKIQLVIDVVFDIFVSALLAMALPPVISQLKMYSFIKSQITEIPWTYLFMVLPIFMVLVLIHNARRIYSKFFELFKGHLPTEEEKSWD